MTADPASSSGLDARLTLLEHRERRWRIAATMFAGLLGLTVLCGSVWRDSPRLDVRELRLIDEHGRPRLLLTLAGNGHPKMLMVDADGQIRAQYSGELLSFEDRGTPRIRLGDDHGVQLFDRQGQPQASLSVDAGSFLMLYNRPQRGFARIGIDRDGVKYATQSSSMSAGEVNPQ